MNEDVYSLPARTIEEILRGPHAEYLREFHTAEGVGVECKACGGRWRPNEDLDYLYHNTGCPARSKL
jgi:hypothetical protein